MTVLDWCDFIASVILLMFAVGAYTTPKFEKPKKYITERSTSKAIWPGVNEWYGKVYKSGWTDPRMMYGK